MSVLTFFPSSPAFGPDFPHFSPVLLIPSVSPGNFGQLSIDLLIADGEAVKVGHFLSDLLVPAIGCDGNAVSPDVPGLLTFPLELFFLPKYSVLALQQRTTGITGSNRLFTQALLAWCESLGISLLVCLTSTESHQRLDSSLSDCSSPRYFWSLQSKISIVEKIEHKIPQNLGKLKETDLLQQGDNSSFYPGGGLTFSLNSLSLEIPVVNLIAFTTDSDNSQDALENLDAVRGLLYAIITSGQFPGLQRFDPPKEQKIPLAWHSVFGPPPARELFL